MQRTPPPTCRKSPVSAGSARIARIAAPAPPCRCSPRPRRIAVGRVCAKRRPSARTSSTGRPQTSAARSTGHSASRASSSGQPSVLRASQSRSSAPSSSTVRMRPSASAASVPGRGAMCSSQRSAVSVRSGSIATTCAPRFCASSTKRHWCRFVESRFAPHRITSRACSNVLGVHADRAAVGRAQGGARGRRADRRLQLGGAQRREQARPHDPALHHALGAREVVGQHRLGAVRSMAERSPAAVASIASSQPMRSNVPSPFAPTRRSGWVTRPGSCSASR